MGIEFVYEILQVGRPNNVPQAAALIAQIQEEAAKYPRIYIASIHPDLTSDDVRRWVCVCVFEDQGVSYEYDHAATLLDSFSFKVIAWNGLRIHNTL